MEHIFSVIGHALRHLAGLALFFWPGWLVLRVLTLGRFPRLRRPGRDINDYQDVELVALVGLLAVVGLAVLFATVW